MWKLFLIASLAAVALSDSYLYPHSQTYLLSKEEVDNINNLATTWTADYSLVDGMTIVEAESKLGALLDSSYNLAASPEEAVGDFDIPTSFDARVQWPGCIDYILDQKNCGSCWAFGASEVLSDRYCINGYDVLLSPQYMVSCNYDNYGCGGGNLRVAWRFLEDTGIPTDQCVSYRSGAGKTPPCPSTCDNQSPITLYKATDTRQFKTVRSIQLEVMENGPIEVGFAVYQDFLAYKSGIYQHVAGRILGGHAVKLVGWGQENGLNYWICANSWNSGWGEKGYFRIAFGECGIERYGIAGIPAI
jgi:cathepsin B